MRRGLILVPVLCVVFAACSSSSKGTAATSSSTTTTIAVGAPAATSVGGKDNHKGQTSVFVSAVDLSAHTITVDPMKFLTGAAAVAEFKKVNPKSPGTPENDYAIVNDKIDHISYPFPADSIVRLAHVNGEDHPRPVSVAQSVLPGYEGLHSRPFWITVANGTVTEVDEQFVP